MSTCVDQLIVLTSRLLQARLPFEIFSHCPGSETHAELQCDAYMGNYLSLDIEPTTAEFGAFLQDVSAAHAGFRWVHQILLDAPLSEDEYLSPYSTRSIRIYSRETAATLAPRLAEQFFTVCEKFQVFTERNLTGVREEDVPALVWSNLYNVIVPTPVVNAVAAIAQFFTNPVLTLFSATSRDDAVDVEAWCTVGQDGQTTWSVEVCVENLQPTLYARLSASTALQIMIQALENPAFTWPCTLFCRLRLHFDCTPTGVDALREFVQAAGL